MTLEVSSPTVVGTSSEVVLSPVTKEDSSLDLLIDSVAEGECRTNDCESKTERISDPEPDNIADNHNHNAKVEKNQVR